MSNNRNKLDEFIKSQGGYSRIAPARLKYLKDYYREKEEKEKKIRYAEKEFLKNDITNMVQELIKKYNYENNLDEFFSLIDNVKETIKKV